MVIPEKLKSGDTVAVVAPARSLSIISPECRERANQRLASLGLKVILGKHVEESDDFGSSSVASRVEDLHEAFANKEVKAILTVVGGFNSNQLLRYLDWHLIKNNPKILCGFSDITALNNAMYARTGLVTYSGPHYSTFGQKLYFDYTLDYFGKCLLNDGSFTVNPSSQWTDDDWWKDQDSRQPISNEGYWVINQGEAEGTILGANLCTLNLLQGTEFMPDLKDSVLFIEDDYESQGHHFDRDLQSLIHLPGFAGVRGLVIGRFQKGSHVDRQTIETIVKTKKELDHLPVMANADFGHTDPRITFPIGGTVRIKAEPRGATVEIIKH